MMKRKCYEDGGLTFAELDKEETDKAARSAIDDLIARQAAKSEEAGGESEAKETTRAKPASKPVAKAAPKPAEKPAPKAEAKPEAPRAERAPSTVKAGAITGPAPAKSREAAMPDVGARKAETSARTRRSAFGGENKGVYGMAAGGKVSSASKRADGCAVKGKTRGRMV